MQPYRGQDRALEPHPIRIAGPRRKSRHRSVRPWTLGTTETGTVQYPDCASASARATWKALGASWPAVGCGLGSGLSRWVAFGKIAVLLALRTLRPQVLRRASRRGPGAPTPSSDRAPPTAPRPTRAPQIRRSGLCRKKGTTTMSRLFFFFSPPRYLLLRSVPQRARGRMRPTPAPFPEWKERRRNPRT